MVQGFVILLVCQLVGEIFVTIFSVPIPGSVFGMLILFVGLILGGRVPSGLRVASEGLLKCLPLFLVPAGVGLMKYFGVLSEYWAEILLALFMSTLVTMVFVAVLIKCLSRHDAKE
ncbi:MAG: CidA/LrgA family protein [Neptuniibacter sp.]